MSEREIDTTTGTETTGHEWDGIKELNTPLPRWWLWTFYATILFSIGYMIYYPAIPLIEGSTMGISGQTNRAVLKQELAAANEGKADRLAKITNLELEDIKSDADLNRFAIAGGASAFRNYCSQCHGSGAQGGPGYPNLNDDDWLWGGDLDAIYLSIKHGIRNDEDDDARYSEMPAFGRDDILSGDEISAVTQYVMKLSDQDHDAQIASAGETIYVDNCATCHGDDGLGDRELGAPNLADAVSLYGNNAELVVSQVRNPKHGVMPAWQGRLSDENIKQLALFVHSLGGGEQTPAE